MIVVETIDINGNKVLNGDMTEKVLYNYIYSHPNESVLSVFSIDR